MSAPAAPSRPAPSRPLVRVAAWYAALLAVVVVAGRVSPPPGMPGALREALALLGGAHVAPAEPAARGTLAGTVVVAMIGAVLAALPVAWMHVLTRAKRGYQQSVVQTLVILPMIVAGVVVLVRDSLALAFSLAGIVAAVRFRTALDDSKDAVYVFAATGVGLAAAVDLPVAAAISATFSAVILALWYTDFGRAPAHLEGKAADRRLEQAMQQLSRTGSFVARIDSEVLKDMTAEQLQLVAERAVRRARQNAPAGDEPPRAAIRLRVRSWDAAAARQAVEPVLAAQARRWRHEGSTLGDDGTWLIDYEVQPRRSRPPEELAALVRGAGAAVIGVECEEAGPVATTEEE